MHGGFPWWFEPLLIVVATAPFWAPLVLVLVLLGLWWRRRARQRAASGFFPHRSTKRVRRRS